MSLPGLVPGLPRIGARVNAVPRVVFRGGYTCYRAGGSLIDGALCRDLTNAGDTNVLQAGVLMGKVTATGKYANSIIGVTSGAYTSGQTALSGLAALITEMVRRNGASGTFTITGPATAGGAVNRETVTYSAASGTSFTISSLTNNYIAGSLIGGGDGSEDPLAPIAENDAYGIQVTDIDNTTNLTVPWADMPISGEIYASQLINWPSDTALQGWLVAAMSRQGRGHFSFDFLY